jgi:sugar phosphate isomerase/epimerase
VCELVARQGSFAADVALLRAAGVSAIGVSADAVDAVGVAEARRILDGEGLRVSSYMGLRSILERDGATAPLDETGRRLEVAAQLGAPGALVLTGPLGVLAPPEADATCRDWLARAAPLSESCGVRIMVEPVHPLMRHLSFVHTVAHGLALVEGLGDVGLVLDLGHVWWEHGLEALLREHIRDVASVQLTNVNSAALAEFRYERAPLDAGDVPVAALVRMLESSGYAGWYEYEVLIRTRRDQRLDMVRASRERFETLL